MFLCICANAQDYNQYKKLYDSVYSILRSKDRSNSLIIFDKLFALNNEFKSDSLFFKTYEQLALYHFMEGDYTKSVEKLIIASDFASKLDNKVFYWDTKNNLGTIYSKLNEFEKAKEIYEDILELSGSEKTSEGYISALSNMGSIYLSQKKLDSSKYYLDQAIKLSRQNNYRYLTAANIKFLAKNYLLSRQYDSTILLVNRLKISYWDDISPRQKDDAIYYSAQANFELGHLESAKNEIAEVFELMKATKKDPAWLDRLQFQSRIFESEANYKKALSIQKEILKLRDSFESATRSTKIIEIEEKYQAEKKEKENILLQEQTIKKDLTIAEKNTLILLILTLFVISIGLLIAWQLRKTKKKNLNLKYIISEKERVEEELEIVRDNIAKDFHDDLGNKLARITALSDLMIVSGSKREKSEIIDALRSIKIDSDELYLGTRDFMFSLKSNSDYLEETITYVSDFGQDFFDSLDIDFYVKKNIMSDIKLPYYWNRQIIMIFKEAITNVARHSGASKVEFSIEQIRSQLLICLADDGRGFNIDNVKANGLNNMAIRAQKIGANLSIDSTNTGTKICFKASLPN